MSEETSTLSPLDKRIWANIDDLIECADLKEEECIDDDFSNERCHIVAMLMVSLGCDLFELGMVAEHLREIQEVLEECEVPKLSDDEVIDADEI